MGRVAVLNFFSPTHPPRPAIPLYSYHQIFPKKIIRIMTRGVPLISSNFLQKNYKTHELPRLCTFDFIQLCTIHFISILFHFYIHFHLYILTYTYSFNLQSHKRIKKLFTVRFVGNSSSFFLLLFAGEVDSIEIFKF
jgi:hypothetical protein